jgi:hypothetical protein
LPAQATIEAEKEREKERAKGIVETWSWVLFASSSEGLRHVYCHQIKKQSIYMFEKC